MNPKYEYNPVHLDGVQGKTGPVGQTGGPGPVGTTGMIKPQPCVMVNDGAYAIINEYSDKALEERVAVLEATINELENKLKCSCQLFKKRKRNTDMDSIECENVSGLLW